jgi:hypothetical protein
MMRGKLDHAKLAGLGMGKLQDELRINSPRLESEVQI